MCISIISCVWYSMIRPKNEWKSTRDKRKWEKKSKIWAQDSFFISRRKKNRHTHTQTLLLPNYTRRLQFYASHNVDFQIEDHFTLHSHTHTHISFHFISFPSVHTTYKMLSHWLFIHVECVIEFNNSLCFQFIRAILFGWFLDNGLFQHTQLSLPSTINTDIWRDDYNNFAYGLFSVIFVLHEWMCVWFVWTTTINVFLGF